MAEGKKEKSGAGKVLDIGIEEIARGFFKFVAGALVIAAIIDTFTSDQVGIRQELPFGQVFDPQPTNLLGRVFGFISMMIGTAIAAFWTEFAGWIVVLVLLAVFLAFMKWTPVKDEPAIWQRMMNALFHGVHAGARKGGGLTVKGARRGVEGLRRKHAEDVARKQAAMLAALDEESFPIEEDGLVDGLEALDIEQPAFPLPPETLKRKQPGIPLPQGKRLVISMKRKRGG